MTTIHTRQLQQNTQDNYNNTHKTTTTIRKRQLQQYTQDNYNNTHKTTTTIHTRQLQYTQDNYNNIHKTTTTIHKRQLQQYTTVSLRMKPRGSKHIGDSRNQKLYINFRKLSFSLFLFCNYTTMYGAKDMKSHFNVPNVDIFTHFFFTV